MKFYAILKLRCTVVPNSLYQASSSFGGALVEQKRF
jgi:hypothetical protein